jgi:deoxyguanosine kinase
MYIVFEGPIGAGKTTLARLLVKELGSHAQLYLEGFEQNSFLSAFYKDKARWALPMQLAFLLDRRKQLGQIAPGSRNVIADHSLLKESVFAPLVLSGDELVLYSQLSQAIPASGATPDIYVYVDTSTEKLLHRIDTRGRSYEKSIDADYLDRLRAAYDDVFESRTDLRVLRIDTGTIDLSNEAQLKGLWSQIMTVSHSGSRISASINTVADPV